MLLIVIILRNLQKQKIRYGYSRKNAEWDSVDTLTDIFGVNLEKWQS